MVDKEDLTINDVVFVRAYWNHEKLTRCRISGLYETYIFVYPLEGNLHGRMVEYEKIERKQ